MTTLGKYEVIGELAKGSMGVIYRGRDPILDREVALKTIAGTGGIDPELKERFYREARAGARLHHPNVITVYELGEQDGLVFIALELLSGCDLRQFIATRQELAAAKKIEVMAAVCDGLHHAHLHGIIHRDIKPSNVFLTDSGVPKILDFGVARLSASKLTVVGRVLGTPFYMAPEQIMGQPCDARSDLFSLALVTYEVLTYAHPFAGDSIPKRIVNDQPDSLLSHNSSLPAELEPVLNRALAKDPASRYQTADEFGRALREVMREPAGITTRANAPVVEPPAPKAPAVPQYASTEFKMSAILMALQGFDEAVEKRDVKMARVALATVEELAKVDDRFSTAAKESRVRLQDLEASMPPAPPEPLRAAVPEVPSAAPQAGTSVPSQPPARPPERPPTVYKAEPLFEAPPAKPTATEPVVKPPLAAPPDTPRPIVQEPPPPRVTAPPLAETRRMDTFVPPSRPAPAPPPSTGKGTSTGQAPPAAARSRSSDDATSMFRVSEATSIIPPGPRPSAPVSPPPPPAKPPAPEQRVSAVRPAEPPAPRRQMLPPLPARATEPPPGAKSNRTLLLVAGGAAAFVVIALGAWFAFKPGNPTAVAAAATAQVVAEQSSVLAGPSDSADVVVKLKRGDTVNVIHPPRTSSQEWTVVQYIAGGRIYPAGAMKTADLGHWNSTKPDVALYLVEMNAPPDGAGEAQLHQYAQDLTAFIQHFAGTSQQADAQAELDKTNAALARLTNKPAPSNTLPPPAASQPPSPPPNAPPVRPAQPAFNLDAELARANKEWEEARYDQAERRLKRILQQRPDSATARTMLQRVQNARRMEDKP